MNLGANPPWTRWPLSAVEVHLLDRELISKPGAGVGASGPCCAATRFDNLEEAQCPRSSADASKPPACSGLTGR